MNRNIGLRHRGRVSTGIRHRGRLRIFLIDLKPIGRIRLGFKWCRFIRFRFYGWELFGRGVKGLRQQRGIGNGGVYKNDFHTGRRCDWNIGFGQ